MKARRVVTGHDAASKSVYVSDFIVAPDAVRKLGFEFLKLCGADRPANSPDDGSPTACGDYFPPRGGYRFGIFTIPAASVARMRRDKRRQPMHVWKSFFRACWLTWNRPTLACTIRTRLTLGMSFLAAFGSNWTTGLPGSFTPVTPTFRTGRATPGATGVRSRAASW